MTQRLALALALWVIWAAPLAFIALTAPNFHKIMAEFGVKIGGTELLVMQTGRLLGSPLGWMLTLVALPALCVAVSALIIPPRPVAASPERARWPLVVIAIVCSLVGAVALSIIYSVVMASMLMPVMDKLQQSPAAAPGGTATTPAR